MQVTVATTQPHEAAYEQAQFILVATVARFDDQGTWVRVDRAERGCVAAGTLINLKDTSQYPFLSKSGASVVAFLKEIDDDHGVLVFPPTSGGLIWEDTESLAMIASANARPVEVLVSGRPRAQLAAAYYMVVGGMAPDTGIDDTQRSLVLDAAIWGLQQPAAEVAQSAVLVLQSMGVDVGNYHPAARLERRRQLAEQIANSLE